MSSKIYHSSVLIWDRQDCQVDVRGWDNVFCQYVCVLNLYTSCSTTKHSAKPVHPSCDQMFYYMFCACIASRADYKLFVTWFVQLIACRYQLRYIVLKKMSFCTWHLTKDKYNCFMLFEVHATCLWTYSGMFYLDLCYVYCSVTFIDIDKF